MIAKDYLTFEEVGIYLNEFKYNIELSNELDKDRLKTTIIDLIREQKIDIFYYFDGIADIAVLIDSDIDVKDELSSFEKSRNSRDGHLGSIYFLNDCPLKAYIRLFAGNLTDNLEVDYSNIIFDPSQIKISSDGKKYFYANYPNDLVNILDKHNHFYYLEFLTTINSSKYLIDYGLEIKLENIPFNNLRFKKTQLDKIFHADYFNKVESQIIQPKTNLKVNIDDEPTHHKSIGSMTALLATLINMAEYDKSDLSEPYGDLNKIITGKAANMGLELKNDFVSKWLKKVDEIL